MPMRVSANSTSNAPRLPPFWPRLMMLGLLALVIIWMTACALPTKLPSLPTTNTATGCALPPVPNLPAIQPDGLVYLTQQHRIELLLYIEQAEACRSQP